VRPARREDLQVLPGWFSTEAELIQWGGHQLRFPLDDPQLAAMWAEYSTTPKRRFIWSGWLAAGIAAHAQAVLDWPAGRARLARIGLAPAIRGQGLGRDFLAAVIAHLAELNAFTRLELNVYSFNRPAIRLYERLGFTPEAVVPATAAAGARGWEVMRMMRALS
jgi:RimJ/RimL family protein N-acetyltransferase